MTITWLNKTRVQEKAIIGGFLDKLYEAQDTTIPATYIGTVAPESADFNAAWENKVGFTAQPIVGSPVQWYDPTLGVIRDHYTKVPESGVLSSGEYHQNAYVDPRPWSKHVHTFHGDGVTSFYRVGSELSDFPTDYRDIVIVASVLLDSAAANSTDRMIVRKNGHSSSDYTWYFWSQKGTGTTTQGNFTSTGFYSEFSASRATKLFSGVEIVIPDYTGDRDGRSTWLAHRSSSVTPLDDGTLGDDLGIAYTGGRTGVSAVIDESGIDILNGVGAFAEGTVISVYVRNPIPA